MPRYGPFCFKNTTGKPVNDLHVVFTGSGGSLANPVQTKGPKGKLTAGGNQVDGVWKKPLAPGTVICFTVASRFPIQVYTAIWTFNHEPVGRARRVRLVKKKA